MKQVKCETWEYEDKTRNWYMFQQVPFQCHSQNWNLIRN